MAKVKIDSALIERAKAAALTAGYSNLEEFVTHAIEAALEKVEAPQHDADVSDRLRGLGYID